MKERTPIREFKNDLSLLLDMGDPRSVMREVRTIVSMMFPDGDFGIVEKSFEDVLKLFRGGYPGYGECNTGYHDLRHTTDVLLCLARLMHGHFMDGLAFDLHSFRLALISAVMHDTGYIQREDDNEGTGGKYTAVHVERSIGFVERYFDENGWPEEDALLSGRLIAATDLRMKIEDIPFRSEEEKAFGRALFISDLLGQMADRRYLEKLRFLYDEFSEADIPGYENADDLLEKTLGFVEFIRKRLESEMRYSSRHMKNHFSARWNIEEDLYMDAVEGNVRYIEYLIERDGTNYEAYLRRRGDSSPGTPEA
jgi:hypothetical protein